MLSFINNKREKAIKHFFTTKSYQTLLGHEDVTDRHGEKKL
jgi:hypothetical protein